MSWPRWVLRSANFIVPPIGGVGSSGGGRGRPPSRFSGVLSRRPVRLLLGGVRLAEPVSHVAPQVRTDRAALLVAQGLELCPHVLGDADRRRVDAGCRGFRAHARSIAHGNAAHSESLRERYTTDGARPPPFGVRDRGEPFPSKRRAGEGSARARALPNRSGRVGSGLHVTKSKLTRYARPVTNALVTRS
jgi:hypothetical protein